jgi:hypothetical protein
MLRPSYYRDATGVTRDQPSPRPAQPTAAQGRNDTLKALNW